MGRKSKPPRLDTWSPEDIKIEHGRLQKLKEPVVARLMDSISGIGLQTPVDIRLEDADDGMKQAVLITGRHRVEACKRLGLVLMPVRIFDDERHAARWEVDENLARGVLTKAEREAHLRALAEHMEGGVLRQNGAKIGRGRPKGGTREIARQLDVPETTLRRARAAAAKSDDGVSSSASDPRPAVAAPRHRPRQETKQEWMAALRAVFDRGTPEWQAEAHDMLYPPVVKPHLRLVGSGE